MILFITSTFDPHVDYLIEQLNNQYFFRFNTDEYLNYQNLELKITNRNSSSVIYNKNGLKCNLDKVSSIYFRRPEKPKIFQKIAKQPIKNLIESESNAFLRQFYLSLPSKKWLCSPWEIDIARGRINQLLLASKIGFKVPKTIITNNKKTFLNFYNECNQKLIIKTINPSSAIKNKNKIETIFTEVIDHDNIDNLDLNLLKNAPCLFQEFIESEYELRITSVKDTHLAVKIESDTVDWRKIDANVKYSIYNLPKHIEKLLSEYLKLYNLNFGCFDLIKSTNGDYIFLELNPNGQWLWLEIETGIPISHEIIKFLTNE